MNNSIVASIVISPWVLAFGTSCGGFREAPSGDEDLGTVATTESALTDIGYALDTNPDLPSPERGVTYWVGSSGADPHTIKHHFLYLGNSCATNLSWLGRSNPQTSQVLRDWANTAILQRDAGKKVIFRPRYDTTSAEGQLNACNKVEGNSYAQMQNHVQAIAAMLADPEIRPIVAFVEMGYLGSWGEWNVAGTTCMSQADPNNPSCTHACVTMCRPYAPVLLAATAANDRIHFAQYVIDTYRNAGMNRTVGLRRPEFYFESENIGVASTKMGFYNDCFMRSASSDGGTFSRFEADFTDNYAEIYPTPPYPAPFANAAAARTYMQGKAGNGSQGGETCSPASDNSEPWKTDPAGVPTRLNQDSFHYLHPGNRPSPPATVLDFRQTMVNAGQWPTIKSKLGYRYHVTSVTYPGSATVGASVTVEVSLENSGFANISYDRTAYLVLQGSASYVVGTSNPKSGSYTLIVPSSQSKQSARSWNKGTPAVFTQTFPAPAAGSYALQLYVPDVDCVSNIACSDTVKANYAVRLATTRGGSNVFNAGTGTNDLGVTLTVANAPSYSLNVRTYNQANSAEITGLWTVVNDASGTQRTGFSPITFTIPGGTTNVSVGDFQQYLFNHWEDSTTVRPRPLNVTGNVNVGGYYAVSQ